MSVDQVERLSEVLKAFQWTFDNMATPHTSDHFNIPANGISLLTAILMEEVEVPPAKDIHGFVN